MHLASPSAAQAGAFGVSPASHDERAGGLIKPDSAIAALFGFTRLLVKPMFGAGFILYFSAALAWFRIVAYERSVSLSG